MRPIDPGAYERMFPSLPGLELGAARLAELAKRMVKPVRVPRFSELPAGYTYFGQIIAHDLSRMQGGQNLRLRKLRLDSLYGYPAEKWRNLYGQNRAGDRVFRLSRGASLDGRASKELDLPRKEDGYPAIPDERDDFHFIISQLHLGFMLLHNRLTSDMRRKHREKSSAWIFETTRQGICRIYQWLIVNDFLPRICDRSIIDRARSILSTRKLGAAELSSRLNRKLSYEFALAGYRFGHSMVRPSYRLNDSLWTASIFRPLGAKQWSADWRGHRKLPVQWSVQWNLFFDFADSSTQKACRISPGIGAGLGELPRFTIADDPKRVDMSNLAERTLRAGMEAGLPSGQEVARHILKEVAAQPDLRPCEIVDADQQDPLWYYVLKEASALGDGLRLGPVGSWIVVSTILNILATSESSFLSDPDWVPDFPISGSRFEIRDLIRYAGLPVTREDWTGYVEGRTPAWS
jgi:Animal haem peroxidase